MLRRFHLAAQCGRHRLHAVADAQYRHAEFEHGVSDTGRVVEIDRLRSAGQHDARRREVANLRVIHVPGINLGVHAALAHAARNQLRVLAAEIENQDAVRMDVGAGIQRRGGAHCVRYWRDSWALLS